MAVEQGVEEIAKDDCLREVQDQKTTLQAEGPNLNSQWRKALPTLSALAKTGERDGIPASFAMS